MEDAVSARRLRATVERLASFTTRNTLSPGLTESAEWLAGEFRRIPGLKVELMRYTIPKGRRVPEDKEVVQVVATLPGRSDRRVIAGGHLDSLNLQVDPVTGRAPGANDDGSGVALTLELARVMARRQWANTLVFVAFSGEEQGLHGARALAKRAKAEGWRIDAMMNNDIVGSSRNKAGQSAPRRVRVFSDEGSSRELARFAEWAGRRRGFGVKLVLRRDRFGRGGDHTPFHQEGFPAVRFIEVHEEYTRQHTPDDLPEYMDWRYLANVTRTNLRAAALLADAAEPPTAVRAARAENHSTKLTWKAARGVRYAVYWRDTASAAWQGSREVGAVKEAAINRVNVDDHLFAVGAVGGVPVPPE